MPWQPGQSGNPGGQSKTKKIMGSALLKALHEEAEDIAQTGVKTKRLRNIATQLVRKAEEGDIQAIKEVFDRTDGKAAQWIEHTGADGKDLAFTVVFQGAEKVEGSNREADPSS